jgi:hypothetical protein
MTSTIEKPIDSSARDAAVQRNTTGGFKRLVRSPGPGLITGASDDDPNKSATLPMDRAIAAFSTAHVDQTEGDHAVFAAGAKDDTRQWRRHC